MHETGVFEQLSQLNEVLEWCVCWLIAGAVRNL